MLKHRIAVVVLLAIVLPLLTGCGSSGSPLVGRWEIEGEPEGRYIPLEIDLLKDGTGTCSYAAGYSPQTSGVTWKTENGRLYLTKSIDAINADYKLSGSTLTLTNDTEQWSYTYKKKK